MLFVTQLKITISLIGSSYLLDIYVSLLSNWVMLSKIKNVLWAPAVNWVINNVLPFCLIGPTFYVLLPTYGIRENILKKIVSLKELPFVLFLLWRVCVYKKETSVKVHFRAALLSRFRLISILFLKYLFSFFVFSIKLSNTIK